MTVSRKLTFTEPFRAISEIATLALTYPLLERVSPKSSGVIVTLPGFLGSDSSLYILRKYLSSLGYTCYGWDHGFNLGLDDSTIASVVDNITCITETHGQPVTLIGHSLGGVYAREIAKKNPSLINAVITLGAPFNNPDNNVSPIIRTIYSFFNNVPADIGDVYKDLIVPPSCRTIAISSKNDGIVHWESCFQTGNHPNVRNLLVKSSHAGMAHSSTVLYNISRSLTS